MLEEVNLALDELEAVRLADFQGLYQEDAARLMNISRQTFGNIVNSAHRKIADALLNAKALKIEGGVVKQIVSPNKEEQNENMHTDRNKGRVECKSVRPFRKRALLYRV
jgi:predicted DNA-binding protein (UPF0251 family)